MTQSLHEITRLSLDAYALLIDYALDVGWQFRAPDDPYLDGRSIILRHDVDYSPTMAEAMAEVNALRGVAGTFFVLLRCQTYNALSDESLARFARIADLGQRLGVHVQAYGIPAHEAASAAARDYAILQEFQPRFCPFLAWHSPEPAVIEYYLEERYVAGLLNLYSRPFIEEMQYVSDSNLRNRPADFAAALAQPAGTAMHMLLHPLNWVAGGKDMKEIFSGTWHRVIRETEEDFLKNRAYVRALPDGLPNEALIGLADALKKAKRDWTP